MMQNTSQQQMVPENSPSSPTQHAPKKNRCIFFKQFPANSGLVRCLVPHGRPS